MGENRDWLKIYVNSDGKDLSPVEKEKALDIAETAFHGRVGVGEAARIGIESAKKLRNR